MDCLYQINPDYQGCCHCPKHQYFIDRVLVKGILNEKEYEQFVKNYGDVRRGKMTTQIPVINVDVPTLIKLIDGLSGK